MIARTKKSPAAPLSRPSEPEEGTSERRQKLGEVIANKIMADIEVRGWPVGELIGSESELIARYGVSRAIICEAVRQVERHGVAEMQRGGGRGLVVTSSPSRAVSRSISTYLELCNVSLEQQYEAWRVIEVWAVGVATIKVSDENCARLREMANGLLTNPHATQVEAMALRIAVADATENPVIGLFMRSLARVLTMFVRPDLRRGGGRVWKARMSLELADLVEAIVARDIALANHLARTALEHREEVSRRLGPLRPDLSPGPFIRETPQKRAEVVAIAIANDLEQRKPAVGEKLGEEPELQVRYDTSRGVFRQAVRILETHGLVRTRRGPGGGLFVGQRSDEYTVTSAVAYMKGMKAQLSDVAAVQTELMGKLAQLAAERGDSAQKASLAEALEHFVGSASEQERRRAVQSVYQQLGMMAGNQVLGLLSTILNTFVVQSAKPSRMTAESAALFVSAVEAVIEEDGAMARRSMTHHLMAAIQRLQSK